VAAAARPPHTPGARARARAREFKEHCRL
jgi:hypothetical protein